MGNYLKYVYKLTFLVFSILAFAVLERADGLRTAVLVFLAGFSVLKDKYFNNTPMNIVFALISCLAVVIHPLFFTAASVSIYDLVYEGRIKTAAATFLATVYLLLQSEFPVTVNMYWIIFSFVFFAAVSAITAITFSEAQKNLGRHINLLDEERRLRYELETTKSKLLSSTQETARLAEAAERNRIAREIHDNVGHSVSGILIQLQAASKLLSKGGADDKALKIIDTCAEELSGSLSTLRETVHNIRPREPLGHDYLLGIVNSFRFCELDFKSSGDLNKIPPEYMEIISATLKEALTNISRHSGATKAWVSIENNTSFVRLLVKDNGKGRKSAADGLGLSGMKERIRGAGGTISFGPSDEGLEGREGFMIVCLLLKNEGGG